MALADVLDRLVSNFQEAPLPVLTARRLHLPRLPGKVDVLVGMRRTGKTSFVYQKVGELLASGTPRDRLLYLNFEDDRLAPMTAQDLDLAPEALYRRHPGSRGELCWFFFDEVQNVPGWERFVRRLVDSENVKVAVTGSSARLLSREIATSLRGRSFATEVPPFDFEESLRHAGIALPRRWPPAARQRSEIEHAFQRYLETGGFPEVQGLPPETRVRVLRDYVDVVLFRDVVERHGVTNVPALRYLVRSLLRSPAGKFSINRFHNDLRSQGIPTGKDALHEYLGHLEDAFLIATVTIAARSERGRMVNPRKCYVVDHALAAAMSFAVAADIGHLLENIVYQALRRRGMDVHYVVTRSGYEVDFLAEGPTAGAALVQVATDLADAATRERETRALVEAMEERRMDEATLVTLWQEDTLTLGRRRVRVVPAWRWLLESVSRPET